MGTVKMVAKSLSNSLPLAVNTKTLLPKLYGIWLINCLWTAQSEKTTSARKVMYLQASLLEVKEMILSAEKQKQKQIK